MDRCKDVTAGVCRGWITYSERIFQCCVRESVGTSVGTSRETPSLLSCRGSPEARILSRVWLQLGWFEKCSKATEKNCTTYSQNYMTLVISSFGSFSFLDKSLYQILLKKHNLKPIYPLSGNLNSFLLKQLVYIQDWMIRNLGQFN